jgi:hypothetical protein
MVMHFSLSHLEVLQESAESFLPDEQTAIRSVGRDQPRSGVSGRLESGIRMTEDATTRIANCGRAALYPLVMVPKT